VPSSFFEDAEEPDGLSYYLRWGHGMKTPNQIETLQGKMELCDASQQGRDLLAPAPMVQFDPLPGLSVLQPKKAGQDEFTFEDKFLWQLIVEFEKKFLV
jgi:hypothetical protein